MAVSGVVWTRLTGKWDEVVVDWVLEFADPTFGNEVAHTTDMNFCSDGRTSCLCFDLKFFWAEKLAACSARLWVFFWIDRVGLFGIVASS